MKRVDLVRVVHFSGHKPNRIDVLPGTCCPRAFWGRSRDNLIFFVQSNRVLLHFIRVLGPSHREADKPNKVSPLRPPLCLTHCPTFGSCHFLYYITFLGSLDANGDQPQRSTKSIHLDIRVCTCRTTVEDGQCQGAGAAKAACAETVGGILLGAGQQEPVSGPGLWPSGGRGYCQQQAARADPGELRGMYAPNFRPARARNSRIVFFKCSILSTSFRLLIWELVCAYNQTVNPRNTDF